eukprot:2821_1
MATAKCNQMGCSCKKYIENPSKWSKGKCKCCNHREKMHGNSVSNKQRANSHITISKPNNTLKTRSSSKSVSAIDNNNINHESVNEWMIVKCDKCSQQIPLNEYDSHLAAHDLEQNNQNEYDCHLLIHALQQSQLDNSNTIPCEHASCNQQIPFDQYIDHQQSHQLQIERKENDEWICSKCTAINVNLTCSVCGELNSKVSWECTKCTTINSNHCKICQTCEYWKCNKCTMMNDKSAINCQMCSLEEIKSMGVFMDIGDEKQKEVLVMLRKDNEIQRKHFEHFQEILSELNSTSLFINTKFMEKHLDSNGGHIVTTFIDVIQELAEFLRENNKQLLEEIKLAIECQTYQPKDNLNINVVEPVWNNLNECVCGLFDIANEFLELRDEFCLVLMDIMWKPNRINMKESVILKLKENISNNQTILINKNDYCDNKVFKSLNKINQILPGKYYYDSLLENIPKKREEIDDAVDKINDKVKNYKIRFNQRTQDIETKKIQLSNKKSILEDTKTKLNQVNGTNYELAQVYCDKFSELIIDHNSFVETIDEDIRKLNRFSENFENSIQPNRVEIAKKKEEYEHLILNLQISRSITGIQYDNIMQEFLDKANNLTPLTLRICSRIVVFEIMISTLSELLIRTVDDGNDEDEKTNSPKVETYFTQPQIRLNDFIEPLHDKNIYTLDDFKKAYEGEKDLFKHELLPYLKRTIGRRVKKAEERRLRRLCQANK